MRWLRLSVTMATLVGLLVVATSASAITTYNSCFQLQNLSSSQATIKIVYYNQDGSTAASVDDSLDGGAQKTYCPLSAVSDGFNGSVVVSSDQPLASISNVVGDGWTNGASFTGQTSGANTVYAPLLMKANYGYTTWFNVQNAGSSSTDITVQYSNGTQETFTGLQPGAAHTFNQGNNSNLPDGWVGSATITSSGQPIVVTVLEVGSVVMFAYNGFTSGHTNPVMPLVNANNYGYFTGIAIMNIGTTDTDVTVSYTPSPGSPGTACTEKRTISAGQSKTFAQNVFTYSDNDSTLQTDCQRGPTFVGSAVVTGNSANQPLTVIVNQLNLTANKGAAYAGFSPDDATDTVIFPLVMDRNYDYWTATHVVNVGSQNVDIECTFTGSSRKATYTGLKPGEMFIDQQLNQMSNGYVGGATCVATGGDNKIVGIVNELNLVASGDAFLVYEGINK